VVETPKFEAASRREKLKLAPPDKADVSSAVRRLWKLDKYNAMSDAERNRYLAENMDKLDPSLCRR
jgi:hypothetical protein